MNPIAPNLDLLLQFAALTQLGIAGLNLGLIRIMQWEPDLRRAPLLISEVFRIHTYFISITLTIFGVVTWRFASEMAGGSNPVAVWLAAGIGLFWGVRSIMQWSHYSMIHWRGDRARTAIHWALFLGYGALAAFYLAGATGGFR